MTGRDGSPWETCRVQTPSANCPISTAKSFGYQLSIPFMMPCGKAAPNPHRIQAAGAGVRGCHGASRGGCSRCRNLWRRACRGCSWDKSHCHCPAEKGPFLTLRAHYPHLASYFLCVGNALSCALHMKLRDNFFSCPTLRCLCPGTAAAMRRWL